MNIRLTAHGAPNRTLMFSSVARVASDGRWWTLTHDDGTTTTMPFADIASIEIDDEGAFWVC